MAAADVLPGSTTGTINVWGGTKDGKDGYIDYGNKSSNIIPPIEIAITAQDVRRLPKLPTHPKNGYELVKSPTQLSAADFLNSGTEEGEKIVKSVYFEECRRLVEKTAKPALAVPVSFRIRQDPGDKPTESLKIEVGNSGGGGNPRPIAHLDRDPTTAITVLKDVMGEDKAEEMLKKYSRWAQINVWRPIENVAQRWPLMFMNHDGIPEWNYQEHTGRIFNINDPRMEKRGAIQYDVLAKEDPRYVYHYASNMSPEEVWVFSSFDSDPRMALPHGAFWDENTPAGAPPRRSIEVRSLVFWE
ncbi:hypothetical protein GGS26DRAFT_539116 [Hypomontagnella submonticulosa]|nr:hypothetical protein GGS26DRAFT_539116 [Hypomontagnella submonticulosa]